MISVQQIIQFLEIEQVKSSRTFELPDEQQSFSIFNKYMVEDKFDFMKSKVIAFPYDELEKYNLPTNIPLSLLQKDFRKNTFMKSIFSAIDSEFRYLKHQQDDDFLHQLCKEMVFDLTEKDLYHKLWYHKTRKMSRRILQEKMLDKKCDLDTEPMALNYIVDYFPVLCCVLRPNGEIDWIGTQYKKRLQCPIIILKEENQKYFPVLVEENGIFSFKSENENVIRKILSQKIDNDEKSDDNEKSGDEEETDDNEKSGDEEECNNIQKKYTLQELQKIAKENKIVQSRINPETGKRIKKPIGELSQELKNKKLI